MRRQVSPASSLAATAACLLFLGSAARAPAAPGPFEQVVASWMGVVAVIGAEGDEQAAASFADAADEDTFEIDDGDADERPHHHRGDDRPDRERRHHRGGHPHGGPHHPGMGPERMGPPGGPDMHRAAMRAFHEIIRRLGRIERQLGIESGPPSGPEGERPRRSRPEMDRPRGPGAAAERPLDRRDLPEDVRRKMEERMQEGRRRMEQAREKFRDMEERIKQLEAEVARLKAGE